SFQRLRMKTATTMDEFLTYAPRIAAGVFVSDYEAAENYGMYVHRITTNRAPSEGQDWFLDVDSVSLLNHTLPVEVLFEVIKRQKLPAALNDQLRIAAWTRSVLLERWDLARTALPEMIKQLPTMNDIFSQMIGETDLSRFKFLCIVSILRMP